jgi:ketosteroid isomerase-like protein
MMTTDEAEIRMLIENWAKAVRANDFHGILAHNSSDMMMFDVPPPLESRGIDAYRKTWDVFFSWSNDPVVFAFTRMDVTAGSDVAFVTALMRCAGIETNGENIALEFRLTVGLQKIRNQWTVTRASFDSATYRRKASIQIASSSYDPSRERSSARDGTRYFDCT